MYENTCNCKYCGRAQYEKKNVAKEKYFIGDNGKWVNMSIFRWMMCSDEYAMHVWVCLCTMYCIIKIISQNFDYYFLWFLCQHSIKFYLLFFDPRDIVVHSMRFTEDLGLIYCYSLLRWYCFRSLVSICDLTLFSVFFFIYVFSSFFSLYFFCPQSASIKHQSKRNHRHCVWVCVCAYREQKLHRTREEILMYV